MTNSSNICNTITFKCEDSMGDIDISFPIFRWSVLSVFKFGFNVRTMRLYNE